MTHGAAIVQKFIRAIAQDPLSLSGSGISRNVWRLEGRVERTEVRGLLYVKGRAAPPLKWGVTGTVVERLQAQRSPWMLVLLHETHDCGYLLRDKEVIERIQGSVWPLGRDGDYKPAAGRYLANAGHFTSLQEFLSGFAGACSADGGLTHGGGN